MTAFQRYCAALYRLLNSPVLPSHKPAQAAGSGATVSDHLRRDPDMAELCIFFNPENNDWTAYPVGGVFSRFDAPEHVVTRSSPAAALADVLALEVTHGA